MKFGKRLEKKDMSDLKKNAADMASTAQTIAQDAFHDGKAKLKSTAEGVNKRLKASADKIKEAMAELTKQEK